MLWQMAVERRGVEEGFWWQGSECWKKDLEEWEDVVGEGAAGLEAVSCDCQMPVRVNRLLRIMH